MSGSRQVRHAPPRSIALYVRPDLPMMRRALATLAGMSALVAVTACRPEPPAVTRERAIYQAVLSAEYPRHRPWRLALFDSTMTPSAVTGWWKQDSAATFTPSAFENVPREAASQLHLPIAVGIYTRRQVKDLDRQELGRLRMFVGNGTFYVVGLSPVVYAPDSARALVYYQFHCVGEGMCGGGTVYLVARDSGAVWRVRNHWMVWAS